MILKLTLGSGVVEDDEGRTVEVVVDRRCGRFVVVEGRGAPGVLDVDGWGRLVVVDELCAMTKATRAISTMQKS